MLLAVVICFGQVATAQNVLSGEVDYPYLGIRITIPDQWKGQEDGDFLVLVSDTEPGLIGLTTNGAENVSQLQDVADQGWEQTGVSMQRSGDFVRIGAEGMGAEFTGLFQGADARAYIAGVINPFGDGVTLIALTSREVYGKRQIELVKAIADSLKFALLKEVPQNASWKETLPGRVLTSMKSSYSSGTPYYDASGQVYGSYSSYSRRTTIHLCSNGQFRTHSTSSASFDSVGGFGSRHDGDQGQGRWELTTNGAGNSLLRLIDESGVATERELEKRDGKTYLDGSRYYKTASDVRS